MSWKILQQIFFTILQFKYAYANLNWCSNELNLNKTKGSHPTLITFELTSFVGFFVGCWMFEQWNINGILNRILWNKSHRRRIRNAEIKWSWWNNKGIGSGFKVNFVNSLIPKHTHTLSHSSVTLYTIFLVYKTVQNTIKEKPLPFDIFQDNKKYFCRSSASSVIDRAEHVFFLLFFAGALAQTVLRWIYHLYGFVGGDI